jgi:lactate permease
MYSYIMLYLWGALSPFLVLSLSILLFRQSILKSALYTLITTIIVVLYLWQMPLIWFSASIIKGLLVSLDIGLILFSALVFYRALHDSPFLSDLRQIISSYLPNPYLQAIFLGFFLTSLIEGVAGFGTPALIVAPILLALKFRPLTAVLITLVGGAGAVTFGALGTPLLIGTAQGLGSLIPDSASLVSQVGQYMGLINLLPLFFVPFFITIIVRSFESPSVRVPWLQIIFCSLIFVAPYFLVSRFSLELPSLLASVISLALVLVFAVSGAPKSTHKPLPRVLRTMSPYLLIITLLLLTRLPQLPFNQLIASLTINIDSILGTTIIHRISFLLSPGFVLLLGSLFISRVSQTGLADPVKFAFARLIKPLFILTTLTLLVQLMIYSQTNLLGLLSLPQYIGASLSSLPLPLAFTSPIIGMFGSFTTGSATVSNLLFSSLQYQLASSLDNLPVLALALQTVGASAGNMFALHNIIAVTSVVSLHHQESRLMRTLFAFATGYLFITWLSYLLISTLT